VGSVGYARVVRLRQAVLVARELDPVVGALREELGLAEPFHDPGVERFGLRNAVMALGDAFVEVVSPVREGTAAGRHLERLGGDGGYMVMFQLDDVPAARARAAGAGIREVFAVELPDILDVHLHPRDVGGAIVALDAPVPAGSWRWGGPAWEGRVPDHGPGTITGATVAAADPGAMAARWAHVLGAPLTADGAALALDGGGQLRFQPADGRPEGLVAVTGRATGDERAVDVGGVRFEISAAATRG
jgi:glyoxalase-like protein